METTKLQQVKRKLASRPFDLDFALTAVEVIYNTEEFELTPDQKSQVLALVFRNNTEAVRAITEYRIDCLAALDGNGGLHSDYVVEWIMVKSFNAADWVDLSTARLRERVQDYIKMEEEASNE